MMTFIHKSKKEFHTKFVTIVYNRDDILARREKAKDGAVNQTETQIRISASAVDKPLKVGKHYRSSNDGNAVALVRLPAWTAIRMLAREAVGEDHPARPSPLGCRWPGEARRERLASNRRSCQEETPRQCQM